MLVGKFLQLLITIEIGIELLRYAAIAAVIYPVSTNLYYNISLTSTAYLVVNKK